ncbi:MAG: 16S rRNA (adenine(1518)-N(6)/adenine(1519)-N(6))-dimethyltransferase RsmA [Myxococcota bacterium]|nr:16S rRNA (adenine(1518)-N(6)/adenine(1519)-N(6))-dimethyltransferase RsmA [Myxococcota bacterium]
MSAAEVRDFLARHGLLARRDLGQNFLCEESLALRLVHESGVEPGDTVVEIGTGLGVMTRALAARAERVVTLEVDAGLVRALRADAMLPDNVELLHQDVLRVDLQALVAGCAPPVRLVGNLPYSISGPLLRRLLDLREALVDWSVMLQREVAGRLLAESATKAYGSLTVLHRLTVDVAHVLDLSPGCFHPVPKVRSSFLRMRPLQPPLLAPGELPCVERVVRAAFGKRRKTLVNALRGGELEPTPSADAVEDALRGLDLDARARAEALPPAALLALARALRRGARQSS